MAKNYYNITIQWKAKKNNEIFKNQSSLRSEKNIYYCFVCFHEYVMSFLITKKVGKKKNGKELRHVGRPIVI